MKTRELLQSLGLTSYEAEVYEALVRLGSGKVQDLARLVSVPRPQIYVALRRLLDRGMCRETRNKVSYFVALPPERAFAATLAEEKQALERKSEGVRELAELFERVEKQEVPYDFISVLKGPQVRAYVAGLTRDAREEVLVFFKRPEQRRPREHRAAQQEEARVLRKGVKVRCLYEQSALEDEGNREYIRSLARTGEEARVVERLPMNMITVDDRAATFSLLAAGEVTVFTFNHPALVEVVRLSFERLWETGRPVDKLPGGPVRSRRRKR